MKKLIPANLKPSILIKEKDQYAYHLQMTKIVVNPRDPTHPTSKTSVRAIRYKDYVSFFTGPIDKQIQRKKAMGVDTVEVVHDPTLIGSVEKKEPERVEPEKKIPFKVISDEEKIEKARLSELAAKEKENEIKEAARKTKVTGRPKGGKK
jgi:hypothetical protein